MSFSDNIKDMAQGLSHLLYPRLCEGCGKPLLAEEEILCLNCNIYNLPRTAYHHIPDNETAMRFAGRVPIVKATSFAYFTDGGLLQHLLHELKYNNRKDIGVFLGKLFAYDLAQINWQQGIDIIIPVPLHPQKEAARGYNQSALLADGMSFVWNIPVAGDLLYRTRNTDSQTQKTRAERIENMDGAFAVKNENALVNKHVLLVDDVLTTGATLESCAMAILKVPGTHVSIATIGVAN
ncbi:MAG: ComF family protein [Bacteroidetes bacterium]|nr:ComF family protein [Bacteroidota bacterium]